MRSPVLKLVLLPGMDGTGRLFADFVKALPEPFEVVTVSYPTEVFPPYLELTNLVRSAAPASEQFVIVAESFSTPLAIQWAATNPPNLKGLILCAGFAVSPVRAWLRSICSHLAPLFFVLPLPKFAVKILLVGSNAPPSLVTTVRDVVASVSPRVLGARLSAIIACDARPELAEVAVPMLYLQATQDCLVGQWCLEEIRRIRPEVAVAVIAGPHLILQREPQLTAVSIAGFVRQLE